MRNWLDNLSSCSGNMVLKNRRLLPDQGTNYGINRYRAGTARIYACGDIRYGYKKPYQKAFSDGCTGTVSIAATSSIFLLRLRPALMKQQNDLKYTESFSLMSC